MRQMRWTAFPALLALTACATGPGGRWVGSVTPEAPSAVCQSGRGVLTARDGKALFAPNEGTVVLEGTLAPDGAVRTERNAPGADKKPFPHVLEARLEGDRVTGTLSTPRCRYRVELTRA